MFVKVHSCAPIGLDCEEVLVEADLTAGQLPAFTIVGLPDAAVQEARERVKLAIINSGLVFPRKKVTVNLAPADLRKEGAIYDLPMALGVLQSSGQLQAETDDFLFVGELALNGEVRPIANVLSMTLMAKKHGFRAIFVPEPNAPEAALIKDVAVFPVRDLKQLIAHLQKTALIAPFEAADPLRHEKAEAEKPANDMAHVVGQEQAKRALEIAAAGFHNIIMNGPPGSGKTLLARTLPSILPKMTMDETLEVTRIFSCAGMLPTDTPVIRQRPFRSPHHSASGVALVGGGRLPKPGEISLAHRGVLFLDEFPEFPRTVLENLRQPLEDGVVSISRAQGTLSFPAQFMLIASKNPCPCGYATDPDNTCVCTPSQRIKYAKKISGPLLDRIDIHIEVPRVKIEKLQQQSTAEPSAAIRQRVAGAHERQRQRFSEHDIRYNAEMRPAEVKKFCQMDQAALEVLKAATQQLKLSARAYHRVLKIARTIADLRAGSDIKANDIAEALQYRPRL